MEDEGGAQGGSGASTMVGAPAMIRVSMIVGCADDGGVAGGDRVKDGGGCRRWSW